MSRSDAPEHSERGAENLDFRACMTATTRTKICREVLNASLRAFSQAGRRIETKIKIQ